MGRKKIDKTTIEYLVNNLFHKDRFKGFQFTAGRTPLGIKEKSEITMSCGLNIEERGVVIDCSESTLRDKIMETIFPNLRFRNSSTYEICVDKKYLKELGKTFKKLNLEVENAEFAGEWYWFRVKCKPEEVMTYVNLLKENIKMP